MSLPHIKVSYNGEEKKVSLGVVPSLELTDSEVDSAQGRLHRLLRKVFNVHLDTGFYLYEVETRRAMSKESFREPSYCESFPSHWYMVIENYPSNGSSGVALRALSESFQVSTIILQY